jgi:hypothetical protein
VFVEGALLWAAYWLEQFGKEQMLKTIVSRYWKIVLFFFDCFQDSIGWPLTFVTSHGVIGPQWGTAISLFCYKFPCRIFMFGCRTHDYSPKKLGFCQHLAHMSRHWQTLRLWQ